MKTCVQSRNALMALMVAASLMSASSQTTNAPRPTPVMPMPMAGASAVLMPDGRWLVVGDTNSREASGQLRLVDVATGTSSELAAQLHAPRTGCGGRRCRG